MEPTEHLSQVSYLARFGEALALGTMIGLEREWRQRMAGLHTTALVAGGAALFAMIAPLIGGSADPTRIAANVVSGIGFLAGGVILRQGVNVRGLTTAATLWATSAVGVLAGFGFFMEAAVAGIAIVVANLLLYPLARGIDSFKRATPDVQTLYSLDVVCSADAETTARDDILDAVSASQMSLRTMHSEPQDGAVALKVDLGCVGKDDRAIETLARKIKGRPGVVTMRWKAAEDFM